MPVAEILQLAATFGMVGVIWVVQLLVYPAFAQVSPERFVAFHRHHGRGISFVVIPLMTVELATAGYLAVTGASVGQAVQWLALGLTVAIWAVTATVQVPLHNALGRGADPHLVARLVAGNWVRTALWSGKGLLLLVAYGKA